MLRGERMRTSSLAVRPRIERLALAAALGLPGALFIGQGLGYVPGSFMTGDPRWAIIGAALVTAALVLLLGELQRVR